MEGYATVERSPERESDQSSAIPWIVAALVIVVAIACNTFPLFHDVAWVGHTQLQVEFVVTDAATGQPIPGASVALHSIEEGPSKGELRDWVVSADPQGFAVKDCGDRTCAGRESWFGSTQCVYLPEWEFHGSAPGYEPGSGRATYTRELSCSYESIAQGESRVIVPIMLRKR